MQTGTVLLTHTVAQIPAKKKINKNKNKNKKTSILQCSPFPGLCLKGFQGLSAESDKGGRLKLGAAYLLITLVYKSHPRTCLTYSRRKRWKTYTLPQTLLQARGGMGGGVHYPDSIVSKWP